MVDIGLIGAGAIGSKVANEVTEGRVPNARIVSIHNRTSERAKDLVDSLETEHEIEIASSPVAVGENADVVVEVASPAVIVESAVDIIEANASLILLSVAAFRDTELLKEVRIAANENDVQVHVPSGAIAGLDGIGAIGNKPLDEVTLIGYRPPEYFEPYVDDNVNIRELNDGEVIFEGNAAEAAEAFPEHMNVAVGLALAARVNPNDVSVRLEVDHSAPRLRYIVRATGPAGAIDTKILNLKTDTEPETSYIIVFSIVEKLRRISENVTVGT